MGDHFVERNGIQMQIYDQPQAQGPAELDL